MTVANESSSRSNLFTLFSLLSDILECCKGLGKEWISIVGVIGTQRYHGDVSWEQYVAVVLSSFVNKVLENDQVFAILGGEGRVPRENTPSPCHPLQETVSLKGRMGKACGMFVFHMCSKMLCEKPFSRSPVYCIRLCLHYTG